MVETATFPPIITLPVLVMVAPVVMAVTQPYFMKAVAEVAVDSTAREPTTGFPAAQEIVF
jgi:hypothetical protein